jgi:phage baseplate assembly protein V
MDTNEINRQILNLIRKGAIMAVDHDAEMCRVSSGELQTNWIRWLSLAAGQTTDWNPPTVGEQVLLLCPGGDPADGVALRGIYSDTAPAPSHSPTTHTRKFPDGAVIEYDHEAHGLTATLPAGGTVLLIAPASVEIHTAVATIYADTVNVPNGDVVASGISLVNHVHGATMPGPGTTGEPQ